MSEADKILCELLVLRCQGHDRKAVSELIQLFEKPLLYYLRRIVGNEADAWDIFQETWMSVLRSLPQLRDPSSFAVYLYRTGRNAALALLRKRGIELRVLSKIESLDSTDSTESEFYYDDCAAVHKALEKISLPHREVLTLYFMQDLQIDEIAKVLDIPAGTVKSRLYHARQQLAKILSGESNHD